MKFDFLQSPETEAIVFEENCDIEIAWESKPEFGVEVSLRFVAWECKHGPQKTVEKENCVERRIDDLGDAINGIQEVSTAEWRALRNTVKRLSSSTQSFHHSL